MGTGETEITWIERGKGVSCRHGAFVCERIFRATRRGVFTFFDSDSERVRPLTSHPFPSGISTSIVSYPCLTPILLFRLFS